MAFKPGWDPTTPMDLFTNLTTALSYRDSIFSIAGAGLIVHLVFKRTETHDLTYLIFLLVGLPTALSVLYVHHFSSTLSAVACTFLTYWLTLATSIVFYRLSPWHPLAKYPGPLICKLTKFQLAFVCLQGKQHNYYYELHQRYGDVVRVGPNELSFRDAAAIGPLMGPTGLPKGPFWDGRLPEDEDVKPVIALNTHEHLRRRRPWTRALNTAALKGYEDIINKRCIQLVDTLADRLGTVDLAQWISFFAYDFMNDLVFGGGVEMMRNAADDGGLLHLLETSQRIAIFMSQVPWLGALFFKYPSYATPLKEYRNYAKRQTKARMEKGSTFKDLYYFLINEDGFGSYQPSEDEVLSDGELAIVAGSDTTSSAVTNLFYFLVTNPAAYARLQAEVDELGDDVMDYGKHLSMPYLTGAINESLRLFPPVLSGTQRYAYPGSGGRVVGTNYIPEGTAAFIPFFTLHRDPKNFAPLPNSFLPERWLSEEKQMELEPGLFKDRDNVTLNNDAFIPFSFGPHNCVGKNLAWMQMRMVVCLLMQRFDMKLREGYSPDQWYKDIRDYNVMMKGELPIVLTLRK